MVHRLTRLFGSIAHQQCGHVLLDTRDEAVDAGQGRVDWDRAGGFEFSDDGSSDDLGRCESAVGLDDFQLLNQC